MTTIPLDQDATILILFLSILGFVLSMLLTPIYTYFAYKYEWWEPRQRTEATTGEKLKVIKRQTLKRNIPRTAGIIVVLSITVITLIFNLSKAQTWLPLAALLGGGLVGFIDDMINVSGHGGGVTGIRAPIKFTMVTVIATGLAVWFFRNLGYTSIHIPWLGQWEVGIFIIPIFILAVVATGNAVNISDGIDGLAGGLLVSAFGAFGIIAALQGNFGIAAFCFTVVGAMLSYLWFNIAPARFIMGDVGSFGLGTSLGVIAMLTNSLFLLPLIGLVFVLEGGSSLVQILSKRFFHHKVFAAAPIHHHFENSGWPKTKVTMRFWVIGEICAAIGVVIALIGGFI